MSSGAHAVGIDLAWSDRHATAVCVADPDGAVVAERMVTTDDEIIDAIVSAGNGPATVAIDAPLVVPNETGRRACEGELHSVYGARHAGPHPSNRQLLTRFHGRIRGEDLLARLMAMGYTLPGARASRTVFECYPHPAIIEMFELDQRLRYKAKRGMRVADRRAGLAQLSAYIDSLADADPRLVAHHRTVDENVRGKTLKAVEDALDARICAWVAALWNSEPDRVRCFGDADGAHIMVPRPRVQATG